MSLVAKAKGNRNQAAQKETKPPPSTAPINVSNSAPALTIDALAKAKGLPPAFLRELELKDLSGGGVGIPYFGSTGEKIAVKKRTVLKAKDGSYWPKGKPLAAYGQNRLDAAAKVGFLILVEGESDCWALWHQGLPALGIPGANAAKTLLLEHVESVETIYCHREPDKGGETFVEGVRERLVALGFRGKMFELRMPDGVKDPADLHKAEPSRFKARLEEAIRNSTLVAFSSAAPHRTGQLADYGPDESTSPPEWPKPPDAAAFHGLAGDFVRIVDPHTEADPVALLAQLLVGFGNAVGRTAHFVAEADRHYLNEYLALIGRTSKARKGASWGRVRALLDVAASEWAGECITDGLSSGEGLIHAVRDAVYKQVDGKMELIEEGAKDKRLLCCEAEFAAVLKRADQQGNTLSAVLRNAWDRGELRTLTRNNSLRATGAHVSFIGHITQEELKRYLSATESANGFGNRILWLCARRSKALPDGGNLDPQALTPIADRLRQAVEQAQHVGRMERDEKARAVWHAVYGQLSEERPGQAGALLGRGEAHVMRLACLYALLDLYRSIGADHLQAALALWEYVERSVFFVFGDSLGDPVADELLDLLRGAGNQGVTRTEMNHYFRKNRSSAQIGRALGLLLGSKLARKESISAKGAGRPEERWFATSWGN
jgi:hypothetical protein